MGRLIRFILIILIFLVVATVLLVFVAFLRSLFALLFVLLLVLTIVDYFMRRYRNSVSSLNSAIRAVCDQEGAIVRVAHGFSRSGPVSSECYEFTRRLKMGEAPMSAAIMAGVPLQLRTAVAMENGRSMDDAQFDREAAEQQLESVDSTMMPIYGQFIYLLGTALVTSFVLTFLSMFILPTMRQLLDEFGLKFEFEAFVDLAGSFSIGVLLVVIVAASMPLLAALLGMRAPGILPMMPKRARRKAEFLQGLAAGYDARWPVERTLGLACDVYRKTFDGMTMAVMLRHVQSGVDPIHVVKNAGWLSRRESAWIDQSDAIRTAQVLRAIADQNLRDGAANLRSVMGVFYPIMVFLIGITVAVIVVGFFGALVGLISGLS
ncbi:MAG: hypothetical protein AAGG48_24740 [Planctomycetota bacterium]